MMSEPTSAPSPKPQGPATALLVVIVAVALGVGVGVAGGQGGATLFGLPAMLVAIAAAFVIQWFAFVPAFLRQTEHFYDLTGSLTYLTAVGIALASVDVPALRSLLLVGMVAVWSMRLGTFLFRRVRRTGKDGRFDDIKRSAPRFLVAWTLQGLWVSLTLAAALAVITTRSQPSLGALDVVGAALWAGGFLIEVVADNQKSAFKEDERNRGRFLTTGLWAWSRHPNYFGEILLWVGVALVAASALQGWQWVTLISPVFVALLLTKVSGVPLLEQRADERWGGQRDYEEYKAKTPVLVPRPPR